MNLKPIYWYLVLHTQNRLMTHVVERLSPKNALDTATAVLDVFPADQLAMVLKLIGLYSLNRLDEALAFANDAVLLYPHNITLHGIRGNILSQRGQNDAALIAYDNVLTEQPDHAAALLHRASILADMGHTDLALACYEQVIQNDRNTADNVMSACIAKGSILVQADRTTELERFCNELLSKYDGSPAVLSMVGAFHCNIDQPDEGLNYYKQALDLTKSNAAMAERLRAIISEIVEENTSTASVPTENATDCRNGGTAQID